MKRFSVICLAYFTLSSVLDVFPILNSMPIKLGNLSMIPPILYSIFVFLRKFSFKYAWFFIIALMILMLPPITYNEFDPDKLTKLLIMISTLAFVSPFLLNNNKSLRTFFNSLAALSIIIAIYSLFNHEEGYSRLVVAESNPIWISRYIAFGLFWLLLLYIHKKIKLIYFIPIGLVMLFVMVSTGSKGPLFAFFFSCSGFPVQVYISVAI